MIALTLAVTAATAIAAALSSPARPKDDVAKDAARKPAELLAFSGVKEGDQVADLIPGSGYFTRPFAKIVGPKGHVYAIVPSGLGKISEGFAKALKRQEDGMKALAAEKEFANVSALVEPLAPPLAPAALVVVWTSQYYHDIYGYSGADAAAKMNAAVFAALKPGGTYVVVDHAGADGSGATGATTLHRIEEKVVKDQVLAAGFVLDGESAVLENKADPRTAMVFAPEIRGKTDQFILRFKKPPAAK
jgi:predicted methyltransferase